MTDTTTWIGRAIDKVELSDMGLELWLEDGQRIVVLGANDGGVVVLTGDQLK